MTDDSLLYWTEVLTGLEPERVARAREQIAVWGFEHVSIEMLEDSVDAAVAATLLVEGIEHIVAHGPAVKRLQKKLRRDRDVWGTWAEIRAADILLHWVEEGTEVRLEEGRSHGAHADLRLLLPNDPLALSVEVKAIGLSDDEVAFCKRMAPSLPKLTPKRGLAHAHAPLDGKPPKLTREQRQYGERESRRRMKTVPRYPQGLCGATIVGHGSEKSYVRRVIRRVEQAVRQLPAHDECAVAVYWSNGAPAQQVAAAIDWKAFPPYVSGLVLVGCGVAFPDRQIHCYTVPIARGADAATEEVRSQNEGQDEYAKLVLERFECSSGIRAALLYGGQRVVLRRDGKRRILPFNLLLDSDPPEYGRTSLPPPWGQ